MILPSKHLPQERALLTVGAKVLQLLARPKTVSALWDEIQHPPDTVDDVWHLSYDWFVLALGLLYTIGAVELQDGRVSRSQA